MYGGGGVGFSNSPIVSMYDWKALKHLSSYGI